MSREIEAIKYWYALPGRGEEGEVLDDECMALLLCLKEARREDRLEKQGKLYKERFK